MLWVTLSALWLLLAAGEFLLLRTRYNSMEELIPQRVSPEKLPTLAVILPARNEVENIDGCLQSLTAQTYPPERLQIIVVDDRSIDNTASIVRGFTQHWTSLRLLDAGNLPSGWLGKSHACWVGVGSVETDWLCFLDADTRHAPELLESSVIAALQDHVDLLTLYPRQEMLEFWERLLMPVSFMSLMILLDASRINDPESKAAMAIGQFILIRRKAYLDAGGHQAICNQVLDDVALARLVKSKGFRIRIMGGRQLIHTRMYTDLKSLWQGLARSGSELFGVPLTLLAVISALIISVSPIGYPLWRLVEVFPHMDLTALLSAVLAFLGSIAWYGAHAFALHTYHVPYRYILFLPLSNFLLAIVNAEGIIRRLLGKRVWKDRHI